MVKPSFIPLAHSPDAILQYHTCQCHFAVAIHVLGHTVTKQIGKQEGLGILFPLKLAVRKGILQPQEQGVKWK